MMRTKGFTLIELLIVVVIIALLAALAIASFSNMPERGIAAEAIGHLSAIRQGEVAYNLENPLAVPSYLAYASLDLDIVSTKFTYVVDTATGTVTATRSGGSAAFKNKTIILAVNGTWSGDHPFVPKN